MHKHLQQFISSHHYLSVVIVFFYQKKRRQRPNLQPVEHIRYVNPSTLCAQEPTSENHAGNFLPKLLQKHPPVLQAAEAK